MLRVTAGRRGFLQFSAGAKEKVSGVGVRTSARACPLPKSPDATPSAILQPRAGAKLSTAPPTKTEASSQPADGQRVAWPLSPCCILCTAHLWLGRPQRTTPPPTHADHQLQRPPFPLVPRFPTYTHVSCCPSPAHRLRSRMRSTVHPATPGELRSG